MQSILRRAMLARAILSSFMLLLIASCGPAPQKDASSPAEPAEKKPRRSTYEEKEAVSEKGKQWGGWRWEGKREDCFYTVKRKCFVKKADACEAAGCSGKQCTGDSSAPVKISCKK